MYEIFKNDEDYIRKCFMYAGIFIVVSIVLMILSLNLKNANKEMLLKDKMYTLGATYYEKIYYDTLDENTDFDKLSEEGINVSLNKLIKELYYNDPKEFVNNKTGKKCDYLNSGVTIYPVSNYGREDYHIDINLECGF